MNYRPWGYEPHGLTWLPYPAPRTPSPPYAYKPCSRPKRPKEAKTTPDRQTEKIAQERVRTLFEQAEKTFKADPGLAQRYADLARRIAMRTRTRLPRDLRLRVCRGCGCYLAAGVNSRVRVRKRREPHVATTCLRCGHITRIPLRSRGR